MRYLHNLRHLFLEDCRSLSEMPPKIGELSSLKTLSMFVVGCNRGNQLEELQCLKLNGRLEIRHLERVKDDVDATKANIAEKKDLRELILKWERNSLSKLGEEDVDEKVLEALQPHPNLISLTISGFSGRYLPLWMANSILGKVIHICIEDCQNCRHLPKLGELPHLKTLWLSNLAVEDIIEDEVENGNPGKIQFPALETLRLINLPGLKGFSKEQESKEAFPNHSTVAGEGLQLQAFKKLNTLCIEDCKTMRCLPEGMLRHLIALKTLRIYHCREMVELPEEIKHIQNLEWIKLDELPKMACLPQAIQHLSSLRTLSLISLPQLESLPDWLHQLTSLQTLDLYYCTKLNSLPTLPNLKELRVLRCPEVERRCERGTGEDCHKIAHIPRLQIGGED